MAKLKTGRHTSARKAARQAEKHRRHNRQVKNKIKELTRKFLREVGKKEIASAKKILSELFSQLDKAGRKNIIHPRNAANKKRKLSKRLSLVMGV
jgi:small subunit ribosomal protein S20